MNEWVWSKGGMILTGESWSTGRKILYSVGGRWMNEYGAKVVTYWRGKSGILEKKVTMPESIYPAVSFLHFPNKSPVCIFPVPRTWHRPHPCQSPWFNQPNDVWRAVQQYRSWRFSILNCLASPVTSSCSTKSSSTPSSRTPSAYVIPLMSDQRHVYTKQ